MARQVLPIVGAAIGAWVGAGNPQAIQLGYMIGSAHGPSVDPETVEDERAPIGAIFGGDAGAELVYASGGDNEPA
jgi:hypothetical protein